MKIMATMIMTLSALYANMSNPLMFMLIIIAQSLLISLAAWTSMSSSWFAYILFLIFLGGLMVLFIYITSLASNEMFKLDLSMLLNLTTIIVVTTIFTTLMSQEMKFTKATSLSSSFLFLFSSNFKFTLILAMIYLLLTLIVVVKIANKMDAPLKTIM